jgi:signal transduction histidine kinase
MKRIRSITFAAALTVFLILLSSGVFGSLVIYVCYRFGFVTDLWPHPTALLILLPVTSLVVGTVLSLIAGKRLLEPVKNLAAGMKKVSEGNFKVQIEEPRGPEELDELIRSFNKMAQELDGTELFRTDFINDFSHEFKTPIASIRGFAKQLQKDTLTPEQRKEYTDIIIEESERLSAMSSNILLLTRFENQTIVSDASDFSLDEQIRSCLLLQQSQWERKGIEWELELEPVQYWGNREMLSHIWQNVIGNAIKFSPEGGKIQIKCHNEVSCVKFTISDSGCGMDDVTMSHIFEKFYKGDASRTTTGNGLGLSLVRRIVDLCGGSIAVKSQLERGSTFIVRLPVIKEKEGEKKHGLEKQAD